MTMKTSMETVSPVKRKITVDVPVEKVEVALEKAYDKVSKKAKLKGFRKGKVPRHLLEKYYQNEAEREAVEEVINSTYPEALVTESVSPVSRAAFEPGPFAKGQIFTYSAIFEVKPVVEAKGYGSLKLEHDGTKVTEEEIAHQLQYMQNQMTQLMPAEEDKAAEKGMLAFVNFKGTAEGKPFEGSEAKNFAVDVGSGRFIPEFEEQIVGMKKGEKKDINFDYAADYFNKELAGKKAEFEVEVVDLKNKIVPELDDEFAKDVGSFQDLAELKKDLETKLREAKEKQSRDQLYQQALGLLVEKHPFEVPEAMVVYELRSMFEGFVRNLSQQGKKLEDVGITVDQFVERYRPEATKRVMGYLILDAVAETEEIEVADEEINKYFDGLASQVDKSAEDLRSHYEKENLLDGLKMHLLHKKVLDFVLDKAKIKVKKVKKGKK